jgi:hypothetical protein
MLGGNGDAYDPSADVPNGQADTQLTAALGNGHCRHSVVTRAGRVGWERSQARRSARMVLQRKEGRQDPRKLPHPLTQRISKSLPGTTVGQQRRTTRLSEHASPRLVTSSEAPQADCCCDYPTAIIGT